MDKSPFSIPSSSREPNPLRPYYVPPSVGTATYSTQHARGSASPSSGPGGSSLGDLLPDIDLDLKSTTSEAWQQTRALVDALLWRYASVCLAQPFDVAKTLLQVGLPPEDVAARRGSVATTPAPQDYSDTESGGNDDIPDYFTATAPRSRSPRRRKRASRSSSSQTPVARDRLKDRAGPDPSLRLRTLDSVTHAISALHNTSGAAGLWRATNATFLYSILLRSIDGFLRNLLLALLGLPDIASPDPSGLGPGLTVYGAAGFSGLDLSESPNPMGSLIVVGISSCITGILLAPLDLVRTRLIIAPTWRAPRGVLQNLRRLPYLLAPSPVWLPTALHHSIPQMFSAFSPLFLRRQLSISPDTTPSLWSMAAFCTSLGELFIRLPLETIVRRAQVHTITTLVEPDLPLVIEPAPFVGVSATVYNILYVEGETTSKDRRGVLRRRRGQGVRGLVRGWNLGFWGLLGVWGAGLLGPGESRGRKQF